MRRRIFKILGYAFLVGLLAASAFTLYLDLRVKSEFEGRRFALPARIYARPLELHVGLRIASGDVEDELKDLGYASGPRDAPGWYVRADNALDISVRPFLFADGPQPARRVRVTFDGGTVSALSDAEGRELPLARLEPAPIGGIYPAGNEDRVLVRLRDVPPVLVKELVATEDHNYYAHHGFDPRALARAVLSLGSQRVQGGSTITQQLVKTFFLTPERTLSRKFTELVMAVLLELHYGKEEILETYLNEIYLGQLGSFGIKGMGEAARVYFHKDVANLTLPECALLAGMIHSPN